MVRSKNMDKNRKPTREVRRRQLSARERTKVDRLVTKVAKEYGQTLRMLGSN